MASETRGRVRGGEEEEEEEEEEESMWSADQVAANKGVSLQLLDNMLP